MKTFAKVVATTAISLAFIYCLKEIGLSGSCLA
jgi:hypothetical protein